MCGFAGELRFGAPPISPPWSGWPRRWATGAPTAPAPGRTMRIALAHRRLKIIDLSGAGDSRWSTPSSGCPSSSTAASTTTASCARELERDGYRFFSTSDTEVILKAYDRWGARLRRPLPRDVRVRGRTSTAGGRLCWRATGSGSSRCTWREVTDALRFASTLPALLAGGGVDTELDPVALHHYLSWHAVVPAPHTILRGVRKLAPATVMLVEPDGRRARPTVYWRAGLRAARTIRRTGARRTGPTAVLEALRAAVSGGWSPTCRSACCSPAALTRA